MKKPAAIVILVAAIAQSGVANAQTYDEMMEGGGLQLSNMEQRIATILEHHGVSRECMGKLSVSDAAAINQILTDNERQRNQKRQAVQAILDRKC